MQIPNIKDHKHSQKGWCTLEEIKSTKEEKEEVNVKVLLMYIRNTVFSLVIYNQFEYFNLNGEPGTSNDDVI